MLRTIQQVYADSVGQDQTARTCCLILDLHCSIWKYLSQDIIETTNFGLLLSTRKFLFSYLAEQELIAHIVGMLSNVSKPNAEPNRLVDTELENKRSLVRSPARPIFLSGIDYSHCDRIYSSLTTTKCFGIGYVGKLGRNVVRSTR